MGKKRKHQEEAHSSADEVELGTKKRKVEENGEESDNITNGFNNITVQSVADSSRYEVYLIKKPITMTLDELEKLKWSLDDDILSKTKLKTESGNYRVIVSAKNKKKKMVHIPAITEVKKTDSQNIKAAGFVNGTISILPAEVKKKYLGGLIYEEGDEASEDVEIHPNLQKIKKTAHLDLESRKQRNLAYGTKSDGSGAARKLPDIIPK